MAATQNAPAAPPAGFAPLEIVFKPDPTIHDGRYANNGWMQELPKPITRLTWGNAAMFSPATASHLGVKNQDVVTLWSDGRTVDAPVWIVPGHADDCVTVHSWVTGGVTRGVSLMARGSMLTRSAPPVRHGLLPVG